MAGAAGPPAAPPQSGGTSLLSCSRRVWCTERSPSREEAPLSPVESTPIEEREAEEEEEEAAGAGVEKEDAGIAFTARPLVRGVGRRRVWWSSTADGEGTTAFPPPLRGVG